MSISQTADSNTSFKIDKRLQVEDLLKANPLEIDNGKDVIEGLTQTQKSLPPRYFYNERGSQLFEQICQLPEYYPTRTEAGILEKYASEIAEITGSSELIELGSGSSTKTRLLLDAYRESGYPLRYVPIDVSGSILEESAFHLLKDYPSLQIHGLVSTYELAMRQLPPSSLSKRMMFFLGSTIGNLTDRECDRFFTRVTNALAEGDYFLLGIDLQKPSDILEAAYNDVKGVTAAFNLNVLQHLNERFQGNFDLDCFKHRAFYNSSQAQIEMHLLCARSHSVRLEALDLELNFPKNETIRTEISRKFDLQQMKSYLQNRGLKLLQTWTDPKQWFGILLTRVHSTSLR